MARGHPAGEAGLHRVVGHHLEKPRVRVIGLVAVDVDPAVVRLRELEDTVYLAKAELRGRFVVGDAADAVDAEGRLVTAPLVDCHLHLDSSLTAGRPRFNESGTLIEGIEVWGELKPTLTEQDRTHGAGIPAEDRGTDDRTKYGGC